MTGLLFVALQLEAVRTGTVGESWELVLEFAAAQTLEPDKPAMSKFYVLVEAMLNCLKRERA
ncbi:MAG: hypothetical protein ND866_05000 [Pyrinomonadaceae bacterium]|nr:hypothetical protein [Pyrinomonadaceae bacterium]